MKVTPIQSHVKWKRLSWIHLHPHTAGCQRQSTWSNQAIFTTFSLSVLTQSYEEHSEKIKGFNNHFHSTTDAKVSFTDWITPFTEHWDFFLPRTSSAMFTTSLSPFNQFLFRNLKKKKIVYDVRIISSTKHTCSLAIKIANVERPSITSSLRNIASTKDSPGIKFKQYILKLENVELYDRSNRSKLNF